MKVYFPQWQGSGTGENIATGAQTVLTYCNVSKFVKIPLSRKAPQQKHHINFYEAIVEQLKDFKNTLQLASPKTIQTIGGDCGLEIVPVSYLNALYPNMGVLWFDAHADINRPCDSSSCNFHGMPLRTLLGEGATGMDILLTATIKADQIHYVGLRSIDPTEQLRIDKDKIYAPKKLDIQDLVQTLKLKGITHLYIHFDFDCLEPNEYPHTYYQVPNGVSITAAEECIKTLQDEFIMVGSSVLESVTTDMDELTPIKGIIDLLMK
ncbi:arginase family protein [Aquimarina rhabdastrellae]